MNNLFTIARKDGSGAIIWSADQKRFIIEEYQIKDNTLKNISEMFHVRPESIRNLLRKEGIIITDKKIRNYPRDSHYFDIIDHPDKAYWLGLFYADGTISSKNNQISLGLKDLEHVKKFQNAISATNNKITEIIDTRFSKTCKMYNFTIRDQYLHEGLKANGVLPNKSFLTFDFPTFDNIILTRHFIRGYYDGDGSLSYAIKEPWSKSTFTISFTGNKQFLEGLKNFLGLSKISLQQNNVSKITYQLCISGRQQVLSFLDWLYTDSTESNRLDRKYNKYIKLLNYPAHNPRTLKSRVWPTL